MRRSLALLLLVALALSGCGQTVEVEDQAYALVLGLDARGDGWVELTIRIPRIGHSGDSDSDGKSSGRPYLVLAAAGESYAQALEQLQWSAARELNLSHIALIVASEALASSAAFPRLIDSVAETRHLYTTAAFVVCSGRARDFIEGQETILGAHLSSEIAAMFRHYAAHGYIPMASFAELYYATHSCYSDPTAIWGFPDAGELATEDQPAAAVITDDDARLNADTLTASSRQYRGAALFLDGRMVGRLTGSETLCLRLLTGRVTGFGYAAAGEGLTLSTLRVPVRRVRLDGDRARLQAELALVSEDPADPTVLRAAERSLKRDAEALIRRCQQLGADPFAFADRAAARFATYESWQAWNWRKRYARAEVEVSVTIDQGGA